MRIPLTHHKLSGQAVGLLIASILCGGSFFAGQKYETNVHRTTNKSHVSAENYCRQFKKLKNKDKPARCRSPEGRARR